MPKKASVDTEVAQSANSVVPGLYAEDPDGDNNDDVDDLVYDVFNMVACDDHAVNTGNSTSSAILEAATRATQLLINRIFACPTEMSDLGPVAALPSEVLRLPREKRVPDPPAETVWEKFAKEKGIKKKKRERMVFDETEQEFRPRYGYKGANSRIENHAIVEVKSGQDPMADPWATARDEKKRRVEKNALQQVRNIERATGKGSKRNSKKVDTYDPSRVPGIPLNVVDSKAKRGKQGVREALKLTQVSTASMGRFDEMRKGEPAKKMKAVKRSFRDNVSNKDLASEKVSMKAQLRIVEDKVQKKKMNVTNSLAPYEGILPDAPTDSFKQKKGKGKARTEEKKVAKAGGKKLGGKKK